MAFLRALGFLLLLLGFQSLESARALSVPFRVKDVLPVLPRQISWPVLNNLHSPVNLLPSFVGSVSLNGSAIEWKGACFYANEARLEITNDSRAAVLYLKVPLSLSLISPLFVWIFRPICA